MSPRRSLLPALLLLTAGCAAEQAVQQPAYPAPGHVAPAPAQPPDYPVDSAKCWPETGYRKGVASPVCVTRLEGMLVECGTAALFLQMKSAAAQQGVKLRIVSGFRSMKQQQTLHACYQQGKCPQAAKPGYSHHQDGLALDLNTKERGVYEWLARSAAAFGFRRTVASEPWHWERYPGPVDTRAVCS